MQPQPGQTLELVDAQRRHLGQMTVRSDADGLLEGTFVPGPDYPEVRSLFRAFEEAADSQALSAVDRLGAAIDALGVRVCAPDGSLRVAVHDLQIWSDGAMTCRVAAPARPNRNGCPSADRATPAGSEPGGVSPKS
jgi:hypothetical protein